MSRRKRGLTSDDEALWASTTLSVEPLADKTRGRVVTKRTKGDHPLEPKPQTDLPAVPWDAAGDRASGSQPDPPVRDVSDRTSVRRKPAEDGGNFDHKRARKLARGRMDIDGRIDLHGMRREEARRSLRAFLHRAQLQDLRTVLVITGKGRTEDPSKPWYEADGRGVLKREVPQWLNSPELAPLVVGFTDASQRHGGGGALYVQIRRLGKRR